MFALTVRAARLLAHALTRRPTTVRKPAPRFRPLLEHLDGRDVPASFTWVGLVSSDATVAANWSSYDAPGSVPGAGDDVLFAGGDVGGNVDCTGFGLSSGAYRSVHVAGMYTSTITLSAPLNTAMLWVENGTINPPSSGTPPDITVTGPLGDPYSGTMPAAFYWTGGTINNTANPGTLRIAGTAATALIAPLDAGTVSTGNTVSFEGGATGTYRDGTHNFTGGNGIVVNANCLVNMAVGEAVMTMNAAVQNGPQQISIPTGGVVDVYKTFGVGVVSYTTQMPIAVTGGTFRLRNDVELTVTGRVGGAQGPSFQQTAGTTWIFNGGNLVVPNGMTLTGGLLTTLADSVGIAVITGNLTNSGADVTIDGGRLVDHRFGELKVVGNVTWTGGVFRPCVDGTPGSTTCDVWNCLGTFTINAGPNGARLGPPPPLNDPGNLAGRSWTILKARDGFLYQPGSPVLGFETQEQSGDWKLEQDTATPPTEYSIKRRRN